MILEVSRLFLQDPSFDINTFLENICKIDEFDH